MTDSTTSRQAKIEDFLYQEAALLDDGHYEQWLDLFAPDGRYWVPLQGARQSEGMLDNSIADEDKLLLALRIERLRAGIAPSQQPRSHMQHVLQRPTCLPSEEAPQRVRVRTPFVYAESRNDQLVTLYGHYIHLLDLSGEQIQIVLKRVNLVNADRPLPMIQLFP